MYTTRLLIQPILRASITSIKFPYSHLSHTKFPWVLRGDYGPLQKWLNAVNAKVHKHKRVRFTLSTIFGLSVTVGSIYTWPCIAYCTDGFEFVVDDHELGILDCSDSDEDHRALLTILRRLLVPVFFLLTILVNWGHPGVIAAKVTLILYTTKPSLFSVYLFVEQSCYARKVEVEDYLFICLARVELNYQKLILLGILGSWWVLPLSSWQEAFSMLRNSFLVK